MKFEMSTSKIRKFQKQVGVSASNNHSQIVEVYGEEEIVRHSLARGCHCSPLSTRPVSFVKHEEIQREEAIRVASYKATRELLATDLLILNFGQPDDKDDTRARTPLSELPHLAKGKTLSLDRINVHQSLYTVGIQ
ncbi:hypothetical protein TNCV_4871601 [Trichonephila clavipes]|nr:hypothetical protein TNCV_4871601 [Trichonephila clavipes]